MLDLATLTFILPASNTEKERGEERDIRGAVWHWVSDGLYGFELVTAQAPLWGIRSI